MSTKANILDFPTSNDDMVFHNHNEPSRMAREFLTQHPDPFIRRNIFVCWLGVLAAAGLDIGLMLNAQYQSFTDITGEFTGSPFGCLAVSCLSLAVFWAIGESWQSRSVYGRALAVCGYVFLLVMLMARLSAVYGNLLADLWALGNNVFNAETGGVPVFVSWFSVFLMSVLFTVGGGLFLVAKQRLRQVYKYQRCALEARARLALEQDRRQKTKEANELRNARDFLQTPANISALVDQALSTALEAANAAISEQWRMAEKTVNDLLASHDQQVAAKKTLVKLKALNEALKSCALVLFLAVAARPVHANTAEILRTAPSIEILQDLSLGSTGTNTKFINATFPIIEEVLATQPLGTLIEVHAIGDASFPAVSYRARLQAKRTPTGDTLAGVTQNLKALLLHLAEQSVGHEFRQSELIGSFFNASRNLNRQAAGQNTVILYSDGIENSEYAHCAKASCKFPAPKFSLDGANIYMFGVGQNMPSKEGQALTLQWESFLKKAGASVAMMRRD